MVKSADDIDDYYLKNLDQNIIDIDSFVYDIHTGSVTDNGKTKFAIWGAFIPDKNKTFFNREYRELYVKFKEIIDEYETSLKKNAISKKCKADFITNEPFVRKALNESLSLAQYFGYNIKTLEINDEKNYRRCFKLKNELLVIKKQLTLINIIFIKDLMMKTI